MHWATQNCMVVMQVRIRQCHRLFSSLKSFSECSAVKLSFASDVILQKHQEIVPVVWICPIPTRMQSSLAYNEPHSKASPQVAPPKARMLAKGVHSLNAGLLKMIEKEKIAFLTYYWARSQVIYFCICNKTEGHSCSGFVLLLARCSEGLCMKSVTEDKPNTLRVNITQLHPWVKKIQINAGSR